MEPQNNGGESFNDESIASPNYNEMTQAEREADFRRKHQQYIAVKGARKKELAQAIKDEFGSSSSESDDDMQESMSRSEKSRSHENIEEKQKLQEQAPKIAKTETEKEKAELVILITIKKGGDWQKQSMVWKENNVLMIDNYGYEIKTISKLKIMSEPVIGCNFKIKMSYHQTQAIFGVTDAPEIDGLPQSYYTFARIIKERLAIAGFKLKPRTIQKIPGLPETLIKNAYIYGKIYKKSQVLGKWQQRFIVINKEGILSYKSFNDKASMKIQPFSIRELWTRFDIQDELLVIKIWHNSKKTEFGFPLIEFMNSNNWLYHFFKMMVKGK